MFFSLRVSELEGAGHVHVTASLGSVTFLLEDRRHARHLRQALILRHYAHQIPAGLGKTVATDVDDQLGQLLIVDLGIGDQSLHGRVRQNPNQELEHIAPLLDLALFPGLVECSQSVWAGERAYVFHG